MHGAWHVVGGSVLALSMGLVSYSAAAQCTTSVVGFGAGEAGESGDLFDLGQSITPSTDAAIMQVSAGIYHSAGLLADGTVVCWGSNATPFGSGPNGAGRVFGTNASGSPITSGTIGQRVQILGATLGNIAEVRAGELHTVARRTDGTIVAWGNNTYGQLNVPAGLVATKIAAGSIHNVALRPNGSVAAWGSWSSGIPAGASSGIVGIDAGYEHSFAWNAAGTLYSWGRNDFGQSTVPAGLPATRQADGGWRSSMALGFDGVVRAWGNNQYGQCGGRNANGTVDSSPGTQLRVVRILGQPLDNVVAISSGGYHGLALRADGTIVSWGRSNLGQTTPPAATAGRTVTIEGGYLHALLQVTNSTTDCDSNGRIDCVEIVLDSASDADGNGQVDACDILLLVPSQYPTIQAAIDAAPAGPARTILVAAGTYNQSFSLNGKNVVVRGAPKGGTILDGTGLTTSIARFTGGEPTTAGIENLVFRNGNVGSQIYPKAPFRVGGAVYGALSSAFIRNCRFEANTADFGGAVYLYQSTGLIDGCVFAGNNGRDEAGGIFFYETSGTVSNSTFTGNTAAFFGSGAASAFKAVGARTPGGVVNLAGCTITGGSGGVGVSAVEMFGNQGFGVSGSLVISNTQITGNSALVGTGGLKVTGTPETCVLTAGTAICSNTPRNVLGPFLISGSATVCDCLADSTLDGVVNGADLGVVLSAWGAVSDNGAGDINHDGSVDSADLGMLLSSWGACP
jgi:hypothetical protein